MEKFIDIHGHLIPQFDDGPKSFDESLKMLKQAADQGIEQVFATSHFNEWIPEEVEKEYFDKLEQLKEKAAKVNIIIKIHSGAEIFYHQYVESTVKSSKVTTLGNWGQYVLLEFPMFQMPEGPEEVLFRLTTENYIPVIAHPERYVMVIERPNRIYDFIRYGGLLQMNGGSILGNFGRDIQKTALQILEKQLAHFIASDAHSPQGRLYNLQAVYKFLQDKLPSEYLSMILYENQNKIIQKTVLEPIQIPDREDQGFIANFKKRFKVSFRQGKLD